MSRRFRFARSLTWLRRRRAERDLRQELDLHLELETQTSASRPPSLLQFAHEKQPPLAVRFDANPPSLQTVRHTIRVANGTQPVTARILSLPLYAVDALQRLVGDQRRRAMVD